MSTNVIQPSFASGELAPSLFARVDLSKYHVGLALARNVFVDVRGGASSRPGGTYLNRGFKDQTQIRLLPFQFSTTSTHALEFGDGYMRVILNGAYVLEATKAITAFTNADPGVVTSNAHGFSNGDWVFLANIGGMGGQLSGGTFIVQNVTANTFTLTDLFGTPVNTATLGLYTGGGTAARYYTVVSPYAASDLSLLKYFQSADVMTLTHPSYPSYDLKRAGLTNWSFNLIDFQSATPTPAAAPTVATSVATGTTTYRYVYTYLGANGEESLPSAAGEVTNSATMSLNAACTLKVTMTASPDPTLQLNVYRQREVPDGAPDPTELYGYVGSTQGTVFSDVNIAPDFTQCPPQNTNPLTGGNNPGAGCYYRQRKTFGGSTANPETFYMTQPGNFTNMNVSNPVRDSDAITATLASNQVNAIKHFVSVNTLVILTSSGAWQVTGGGQVTGALTPASITAQPQAYNGSSDVPPLVINYDILYVQNKGSIVRDLAYNFYVNLYTGTDLSVLSSHLFFGHQILEWCWAEEPFKTVWCVREDGILLALAFLKEQEVYGWTHSDTLGYYKSICSISEGVENAVYYVAQRYIRGQWVQYIERQANRILNGNLDNVWAVDAGLAYPLTTLSANLTVPANADGTPLALGSIGTFIASAPIWTAANVGDVIRVNGGKATITSFISTTQVQAQITQQTVSSLPALNGSWTCTTPVKVVGGLAHLEGCTVAILADGNVQPTQKVINGQVTLQHAATAIVVGLPFTCQVQTLYLDVGNPTIQGKRKKIAAVTMRLFESRGLKVGPTFDLLTEVKERGTQLYGQPIQLVTGDERVNMTAVYNTGGQLCIQQDNPLPFTLLGVIPEIVGGDT